MARLRVVWLSCLLVSLAGASSLAAQFSLNHFLFYRVDSQPAVFSVVLTGQFETSGIKADLQKLTHFANPVKKSVPGGGSGIIDPDFHLDVYTLDQPDPERRRTVRFRNQFGQGSVDIETPRFLLVPAQKISDPNSQPPEKADHYKCYEVVRINTVPPPPVVGLSDQFQSLTGVQVGKPVYFCLPVVKEREGEEPMGIFNERDHLMLYDVTPYPFVRDLATRDQFGKWGLTTSSIVWLGVPTEKQAYS